MILAALDGLVRSGRVTGYTVEEDSSYLGAHVPTLTYRMYMDGPTSHLNLGAFACAMGELAMTMKLSRVHGTVAREGALVRSRQLCLTAEFAGEREIGAAMAVVHARFVAAPKVLTLDPESPLAGAAIDRVQVLPSWVDYLTGGEIEFADIPQLALSLP